MDLLINKQKQKKPKGKVGLKESKSIEKYLLKKTTHYKNFRLSFKRQTNMT